MSKQLFIEKNIHIITYARENFSNDHKPFFFKDHNKQQDVENGLRVQISRQEFIYMFWEEEKGPMLWPISETSQEYA